jgi:hypothetical protein
MTDLAASPFSNDVCDHCDKIKALCFCADLISHDNRVPVVILQHPQEPDKELGSARLANIVLKNSVLRTGLSSASLKAVVGQEVDPSKWIVLFLGSKYKFREIQREQMHSDIYIFDKKDQEVLMPLDTIEGVIAIDGTWAQAKTLWWRNAWLLKCKRAVINPRRKSLYGNLRREPRPECLSTIETIAYTLEILGEDEAITNDLLNTFQTLLNKYKDYAKNTNRVAKPGVRPTSHRRGGKPAYKKRSPSSKAPS